MEVAVRGARSSSKCQVAIWDAGCVMIAVSGVCAAVSQLSVSWCVFSVFLSGFSVALMRNRCAFSVVATGAFAGGVTVLIIVGLSVVAAMLKSSRPEGSRPMFEDGVFLECVVFPVIVACTYCPLGAIFGAFSSLATHALWSVVRRQ